LKFEVSCGTLQTAWVDEQKVTPKSIQIGLGLSAIPWLGGGYNIGEIKK